jgi:hypothetical protein
MIAAFDIFADYFQILIRDRTATADDLPFRWSDETADQVFIEGDRYVVVVTARNLMAPVEVRANEEAVPFDTRQWDRVSEGMIHIPTGELIISDIGGDPSTGGGTLEVRPGRYRVHAFAGGLETISEDGIAGEDRYLVQLQFEEPLE